MRALEPLDLLLDLVARFLWNRFLLDLLAVVLHLFRDLFSLTELRLDRLELLTEKVLALVLVHLSLRGGGDLLLHGQKIDLANEQIVDPSEALDRIDGFQNLLRFLELEVEVGCGQVGQTRRIIEIRRDHHDLG